MSGGVTKKSKMKEMTIAEASDFFDEHDIFEFDEVREVKDIKFRLQKKKYVGFRYMSSVVQRTLSWYR